MLALTLRLRTIRLISGLLFDGSLREKVEVGNAELVIDDDLKGQIG